VSELNSGLSLDDIINAPASIGHNGGPALPPPIPVTLSPKELRAYVNRAKQETADEASSYFLHALLLAIETLAQGNKLAAGKAIDEALTHFLADLKAEIGEGYAASAAKLLITNVSWFLPDDRGNMVRAALDTKP
jgi:hypothetical protein